MKLMTFKTLPQKLTATLCLLLAGGVIWAIVSKAQPASRYKMVTIDRIPGDHHGWLLREFTLPSEQSVVLQRYPADTQPFHVVYAPPERRIGVLLSREDQLEFDLLDRSGKMLKQISLQALAESVARPYYRNGQFFVSTPDKLLCITAKDGVLNTIDISGRFPPPIYEVLKNHPRTFVPDATGSRYYFCYGPEVRTPRSGVKGYTLYPPASGQVYAYSVQTGSLSKTSISATDLMPAHKSLVAFYDSKLQSGSQIKIMTAGQSLEGHFLASQHYRALRWSPADTQIVAWDEHSLTCYAVSNGQILYHAPLEFSVEDWDCMTEYDTRPRERQ